MFQFQPIEAALRRLNYYLDRCMPVLTVSGVCLGLLIGHYVVSLKPAVTYLFAFITFIGGLGINSRDFFKVVSRPKAILVFLFCSNILMPLLTWVCALLFFGSNQEVATGFILLMSIPTAITGYIWSSIYKGNGAMSLALILIATIIAPLTTPWTVKLLAHTSVAIDVKGMMISLLLMVVLPSILGILINTWTVGKVNDHVTPCLKPFSKLGLLVIIIINIAQVSDRLIADVSWAYLPIALLCLILAVSGYPISNFFGKLVKLEEGDNKSVTFAASLRNISAALVLAIDYFPAATALPVIFGIVFQQSTCAIMAYVLYGRKKVI